MNVRTSESLYDGEEADVGRSLRAALACVCVSCLLLLAACGDGAPALIKEAVAAPVEAVGGYLPAQFPAPEGAPEAHIEAF